MQITAKSGAPEKQKTGCLVVAVHEDGSLSAAARAVDEAAGGIIAELVKRGDLKGKSGQTLMLHSPQGLPAERLLLVGMGGSPVSAANFRKALQSAMSALKTSAAKDAAIGLSEVEVADRDYAWKVRQAVEAAGQALYVYDQTRSKDSVERPVLRKLLFLTGSAAEARTAGQAIREGNAIAAGVQLTRDLANLPGNVCTPTYLAQQGRALARKHKNKVKAVVLDEKEMEQLGMGALLSVSRGSREPAKLITLVYKGGKPNQKPVVLVGKGLTFDAGGISIKPSAAMDEMKYDMCGGASVLGVMQAVAELELPINLVGVVPSSENLPDGAANKPGDIVTTMDGQTVEILNTDAEGRLILCDALTYSKRFDPALVIDIATLTGACVIALGKHASGVLGNDQPLIDDLLKAGEAAGDRAWQLPLWDEYQDQLKSNFADMANIGGREGGTITAACFLSRYTKDFTWAHIDIAGTAWISGGDKGATGRPVPMLTQYLIDYAAGAK